MPRKANKITSGTLGSAVLIESGKSIVVYGILLSSTAGANITIEDSDGNDLFIVGVLANDTSIIDTPFLADNGINFVAATANENYAIVYEPS